MGVFMGVLSNTNSDVVRRIAGYYIHVRWGNRMTSDNSFS